MSHPHGTRSKQVEKTIDSLNPHIQSDMPIGNLFSVKLTLQHLSVVGLEKAKWVRENLLRIMVHHYYLLKLIQ
jgi:hypothetical protein